MHLLHYFSKSDIKKGWIAIPTSLRYPQSVFNTKSTLKSNHHRQGKRAAQRLPRRFLCAFPSVTSHLPNGTCIKYERSQNSRRKSYIHLCVLLPCVMSDLALETSIPASADDDVNSLGESHMCIRVCWRRRWQMQELKSRAPNGTYVTS